MYTQQQPCGYIMLKIFFIYLFFWVMHEARTRGSLDTELVLVWKIYDSPRRHSLATNTIILSFHEVEVNHVTLNKKFNHSFYFEHRR